MSKALFFCDHCVLSNFMISCKCRSTPAHFYGKEVNLMEYIFSFALSVAAGIVASYIYKWLDEQFRSGKH